MRINGAVCSFDKGRYRKRSFGLPRSQMHQMTLRGSVFLKKSVRKE